MFEIGTEEIPARFMSGSLSQMEQLAEKFLLEYRLEHGAITSLGTPRRLTIIVDNLSETQKEENTEVKGPAIKVAYNEQGEPTKALQGFMKSQGIIALSSLITKQVGNSTYVFAMKREIGQPTMLVLPTILEKIVNNLNFPKPMRWGSESFKFVRPIHSLVALWGSEIVPLSIANVQSGRIARGHRFLGAGSIELDNAAEYENKLMEVYVVADVKKRKKLIETQIEQILAENKAFIKDDEELLTEVNFLLEYPTAFLGKIPSEYLALPEEVIITPMKDQQRYFPIYCQQTGKLLPYFIGVRNGNSYSLDTVIKGNEKVLNARLSDAKFFYDEDRVKPLLARNEKLKKVVFQEKLGTTYEKLVRVAKLALKIAEGQKFSQNELAGLETAAYLLKADLVTNMVFEFPELQGIMGAYYATAEGYAPEVALAIREHYLPTYSGGPVATSKFGMILAIADKMDTIAGCFLTGLIPSGSQDPYALRRQALGICRTILENELTLSIKELLNLATAGYAEKLIVSSEKITLLTEFLKQRIASILQDAGYRYDLIEALLAVECDDMLELYKKAAAFVEFSQETAAFESLMRACIRAGNLTKDVEIDHNFEQKLAVEAEEKALMSQVTALEANFAIALEKSNYILALTLFIPLEKPLAAFFEKVMVMAEDETLRNNRLGVLQHIAKMAQKLLDVSKLVVK